MPIFDRKNAFKPLTSIEEKEKKSRKEAAVLAAGETRKLAQALIQTPIFKDYKDKYLRGKEALIQLFLVTRDYETMIQIQAELTVLGSLVDGIERDARG